MSRASKPAACAVVLAILGVLTLAAPAPAQEPTPDRADAQPASAIPAELPEGATSGTVSTPYGPARWVSVIGDASLIPRRIQQVLPGPTDSLALRGWTCDAEDPPSCLGLWAADGLFGPWEKVPLPDVARAQLLLDDHDTYWLLACDPDGLYRSDDARDWHEVDQSVIDATVSPGPDLFEWRT